MRTCIFEDDQDHVASGPPPRQRNQLPFIGYLILELVCVPHSYGKLGNLVWAKLYVQYTSLVLFLSRAIERSNPRQSVNQYGELACSDHI